MASDETNPEQRKRELTARLDRARTNLRRDLSHVRYRSSFADRTRESVRRNAGGLMAGGLVAGGLAGWRLLRPGPKIKKVYIDANTGKQAAEVQPAAQKFWMKLMSFGFNLAQPAIATAVQKRLAAYVDAQQGR